MMLSKRTSISFCLFLLLLLLVAANGQANPDVKVLPSFRELPPPLIHYSNGEPVQLVCTARPRTAKVRIVFRRPADSNFQHLSLERVGSVKHRIDNPKNYENMDIHCQASTGSWGVVLSRPVRLVKTMLDTSGPRSRFTTTVPFYKGNIAQVVCNVPQSQPPADIEFLKDGDRIGQLAEHKTDKYKVVRLSNSDKEVMLIRDFSSSDVGVYSCRATNRVTLQHVDVNRRTKLRLDSPREQIKARFHVDDPFQLRQKKVSLLEGENATLYCLPEGAPIPSVKWYRHSSAKSLPKNARLDSAFGTLDLVNVKLTDASVYMCSVQQNGLIITSPITVEVRRRLKIINAPRNVKVNTLGQMAKFTCTVAGGEPADKTSSHSVRPEWYHNGRYIDPRNTQPGLQVKNGSLTIASVTTDLLGVYQCVARSRNEWDSASAALAMSTDNIISGERRDDQLKAEAEAAAAAQKKPKRKRNKKRNKKKKKSKERQSDNGPAFGRDRESRREAVDRDGRGGRGGRGGDWGGGEERGPRYPRPQPREPLNPMVGLSRRQPQQQQQPEPSMGLSAGVHPSVRANPKVISRPNIRILFDNLALELFWKYLGTEKPLHYRVQYQERKVSVRVARSLSRFDPWMDEKVHSIKNPLLKEWCVIMEPLKAGYSYRFRVSVVYESGKSDHSEWSNEADFSHILPVMPSILKITPVGSESLRVYWRFDPPPNMPPLDHFIILARRMLDKGTQMYERYSSYRVESNARDYLITQLRPDTHYQMAIYGEVKAKKHNRRLITRFSNQIGQETASAGVAAEEKPPQVGPGPGKRQSTSESTKLMFWILGGLGALMLVVMAVLVGMCMLRQRREKSRSRAMHHAQLNGTALDSYKDPSKMLHRRQQNQAQMHANSQFLLAHLGGGGAGAGPNHTGTWSGPGSGHHHLRGSSASVQHLHQVPGSAMNLNVVPETQSLMMDHYQQQQHHHHQQPGHHDMTTDLGGYGPPPIPANMYPHHGGHHGNGTLGSKSQLSGITSHHHHPDHDMGADMGYPMHTGSVGPYRPLGSGYAPFMTSGQRPSHLDVRPTPAGDAESIYSYFSQQEMGVQHCGLSDVPGGPPMPYRPQLAEAGSQTTDRQQHRHHRRRRRKQPPGGIPPTGPGGPLPTAMEHSVAPSPPMMRDMAVNTDLGSTDGTYDQPATSGHLPYGYPHPMMPAGANMPQYLPPDSSGGATASSAASSTAAYQSVTPPARMASLGPHHGYHQVPAQPVQAHTQSPPPPTSQAAPQHHHHHHQQQQPPPQPQVDMGPAGPADASTLTRRGTPTLFVDPPKMRDYSEYAIPETKA